MTHIDDPELVREAEPSRRLHRPIECKLRNKYCWVKIGRAGIKTDPRNRGAPRCAACGGKILP